MGLFADPSCRCKGKAGSLQDIDARTVRRCPEATRSRRNAQPRCWFLCRTGELHGLPSLRRSAEENYLPFSRTLLRGQYCLHTMPLRCAVQRCELSFIETLHDLVHWDKRVEQIAVFLDTSPCGDAGALCDDETAFLQQTNMLCDRVAREVELLCDGRFTRMALIRFTVRMAQQVDVHRNCTSRKVEVQQLIRNGKAVFYMLPADRRFCSSHVSPPPFVCCPTHSMKFSFGSRRAAWGSPFRASARMRWTARHRVLVRPLPR